MQAIKRGLIIRELVFHYLYGLVFPNPATRGKPNRVRALHDAKQPLRSLILSTPSYELSGLYVHPGFKATASVGCLSGGEWTRRRKKGCPFSSPQRARRAISRGRGLQAAFKDGVLAGWRRRADSARREGEWGLGEGQQRCFGLRFGMVSRRRDFR
jgi:hypothetical protein